MKYGTATTLLPSLATRGGDEEDAGAGDEAADVWAERGTLYWYL
jgi:hypothetical protein